MAPVRAKYHEIKGDLDTQRGKGDLVITSFILSGVVLYVLAKTRTVYRV